jgi:Bacterial HORMA domain family 1
MTSTFTTSATFTRTHAKHLAAKVIADLYQCSVFYGRPAVDTIEDYETELVEMLANEYVYSYEFGFKSSGRRLLTWHYRVGADGSLRGADADSGGIYAKAAVAQADYFNFMTYSSKWSKLTDSQRSSFKSGLPIDRKPGSSPADGDGYWQADHGYSAGGIRLDRKTFRPR